MILVNGSPAPQSDIHLVRYAYNLVFEIVLHSTSSRASDSKQGKRHLACRACHL